MLSNGVDTHTALPATSSDMASGRIDLARFRPKEEKNLEVRTKIILARAIGEKLDTSDPAAVARAPLINDGRAIASIVGVRLFSGSNEASIYIDMAGCGISDCVHCYVKYASLIVNPNSSDLQNRMDLHVPAKLRNAFQRTGEGKMIPVVEADAVFECAHEMAQREREKTGNLPSLALGSGEPLVNRAFILRFATLAKDKGMAVTVDTAGIPGINKEYFTPFAKAGLKETLFFSFSPKGTTPAEYEKFTQGVEGKNWIWPFEGLRGALESGFRSQMIGVMLQHFASLEELRQEDNPVSRLIGELRKIHELLPMLLSGLNTTTGHIGDPQRQILQLRKQGYTREAGFGHRDAVLDALKREAAKFGTPMLFPRQRKDYDPATWSVAERVVLGRIVADLSREVPKRNVSQEELAQTVAELRCGGVEVLVD